MPTADELMELARTCANKVDLSDRQEAAFHVGLAVGLRLAGAPRQH